MRRSGGRTKISMLCVLLSVLVPLPSAGDPLDSGLPNLVPRTPFDITIAAADGHSVTPPYALRFSVATVNRGGVPLDILPEDPLEGDTPALQCIRWAIDHACLERAAAGEYVYHSDHRHYHITDFAMYELRRLTPNGDPDLGPGGLVAGGEKVSSCLMDTGRESSGLEQNPTYALGNPIYSLCMLGSQGISPGWFDAYHYVLSGQQIRLDDVEDGTYALVITSDPLLRFFEHPRTDNVSFMIVTIAGDGARVTCPTEASACRNDDLDQS